MRSVRDLGRTHKLTFCLQRRHSNMMFVDVERRTSIVHTAVEFTMNMSSATACSGSDGLQIQAHEQRRTQHAQSVILEAALLSRTAD